MVSMRKPENLDALFDPPSIAVVGASADPAKWGFQYAQSLLRSKDRRAVYLVNRGKSEILGQRSFASCAELPSPPAMAVVCVPSQHVETSIDEALSAGAQFIVCITSGFAESGEAGAARQRRVTQAVRGAGARLVGPNCLGVFDRDSRLECTAFWPIVPGNVGLVSQSGTVMLELSTRLGEHGLGLSRAVSIGNQADVTAPECLETFSRSDSTRVVVAYLEDPRDARRLFASLDELQRAGKHCVLLSPAASEATSRAVASHTASMLANDEIIAATCADLGLRRVRSIGAAVRVVRGLLSPTRSPGHRMAVIADGGGAAVLGADACIATGLQVPSLSPALHEQLQKQLNPGSGCQNPIDAVGALCLEDMRAAIESALSSDEIDGVLLTGALNNVDRVTDEVDRKSAQEIVAVARRHEKGLGVASMWPTLTAMSEFSRLGVPVASDVVEIAQMLAAGIPLARRRSVPLLPEAGETTPLAGTGYFDARALFADLGVPFLPATQVTSESELLAAATKIGYPVVLKALGTLHKADAGGVVLGIPDAATLRMHFERLQRSLGPPAFSVEAMAKGGGVELIVGGVRGPSVGPTLVVGAGGTLTEILGDTVVALAPVSVDYAADMLGRLRVSRLLAGYRGKAAVDTMAVARAVAAFSHVLIRHEELSEAEINPLLATADGVFALDARVIARSRANGLP